MEAARAVAMRRGVRLEVLTIVWMLVEAVLSLGAGVSARSVLLTAFGLDSVVELLSGIVVLRRLQGRAGEAVATRISAVLLIALSAYVVMLSLAAPLLRLIPASSLLCA